MSNRWKILGVLVVLSIGMCGHVINGAMQVDCDSAGSAVQFDLTTGAWSCGTVGGGVDAGTTYQASFANAGGVSGGCMDNQRRAINALGTCNDAGMDTQMVHIPTSGTPAIIGVSCWNVDSTTPFPNFSAGETITFVPQWVDGDNSGSGQGDGGASTTTNSANTVEFAFNDGEADFLDGETNFTGETSPYTGEQGLRIHIDVTTVVTTPTITSFQCEVLIDLDP